MKKKQLEKRTKAVEKAFGDEKFIYELLKRNTGDIRSDFGKIFMYYLSTADKKHKYNVDEIENKLYSAEMCYSGKPVIDQRYYFQAYNGYCEESYKANGLDDISSMDSKVKKAFELLEQELGKTSYGLGGKTENINRSFITSDIETALHYAFSYAPERLWEGPLSGDYDIIIGEKKTDYMMRIVENKLEALSNITDDKKEEIRNAGRIVAEAYGSRRPRIAIIPENEIQNYKACFSEHRIHNPDELSTIKELADNENPTWTYDFVSGPNLRDETRYCSIWQNYTRQVYFY